MVITKTKIFMFIFRGKEPKNLCQRKGAFNITGTKVFMCRVYPMNTFPTHTNERTHTHTHTHSDDDYDCIYIYSNDG